MHCTNHSIIWRKIGVWWNNCWKSPQRKCLKLIGTSRSFRLCHLKIGNLLLNRLHRGVWQDSALFSSNRLQQHPQNWRSSSGTVRQAPTLSTKVVHSFVHDPFSKGLDGNWDGLCGRLLNVTIRDVLHCPTEENISVILHPDLTLRAVRSAKQSWMPSSFLGSLLRTHPL